MKKLLLKNALAAIGLFAGLSAFGATENVIPSGFSVTEPVPGSVVNEISKISFKSTSYTYLTLNTNVKVKINGSDVEANAELSGSAKSIVTYTLANPITEAGEYEIIIPKGAVSYTYFGDSNESGQFKFGVTIAGDDYVPSETTIPKGFSVVPKEDSTVEQIATITVKTDYMNMVVDADKKIKIDGQEVNTTAEVTGSYKDALALALETPVTKPGAHTVLIPAGFFKYDTFSSSNNPSDIFFYTLTVEGEVENPDPTPETPEIPANFTVKPQPGSEVEEISEIVVSSFLYENMEVNEGKGILIDGNEVAITSQKLDTWGSELGITLVTPVKTKGVHTVTIPAGTFKYAQMFSSPVDNAQFKFTLVVVNDDPEDPEPETPVIITQQPAGELKTYDRTGSYYYNYDGYLRTGAQTGTIDIVFADDNKVYLKDPVNNMELGSWVEGTLSEDGKTLTVQLGQYLYQNEEYGYVTLRMLEYNDDYEWFDPISTKEVTYTIEGEKISLNGTYRKGKCLGVVWEEYNEWAGNCDYGTIYVPVVDVEEVVVPDDIEIESYLFKGDGYGGTSLEYAVSVAFDDNDMYIQGIFKDFPNSWIKGTKEGNKVIFKSPQYMGKASYGNRSDVYMVACALEDTYTIQDLELDFDPETGAYTNDTQFLVENLAKGTIYMTEAISYFSLNKISESGVFSVPYSETFGSTASLNGFTIIDANNDKNTWFYANGRMGYDYCANKADDWLITPPIALEEGKGYVFTLDARSFASMYPERFEVKYGTEPTAEGMTNMLIEPTEVASDTMAPFSGKFSITEAGNYYIGIHAISDPDEFTLYITNLSLVEDEDFSGIVNVSVESPDNNVYSIDGRIVATDGNTEGLTPGIYIINGKKVLVK